LSTHRTIALATLGGDTPVYGPSNEPWQVDQSEPATIMMTDFRERSIFKVGAHEKIDEVLQRMKHAGLRAAFVFDKESDRVLGMITAYDILGEKPLRYLEGLAPASRGLTRSDIRVGDIMEKAEQWNVVDMQDVVQATVQSVLEAMQKNHYTHLPVMETTKDGKTRLRGLFSWSKALRLTEESRKKNPLSGHPGIRF
jgi:CBS domain-containing protein